MKAFLGKVGRMFTGQAPAPESVSEPEIPADEDRLQILVGRQKAITRGRGSMNGSEGLVRDAL
jgi:hypothetical protein